MVELIPAPFADLVLRMHLEFERQDAIFDLPRRKWFTPDPGAADLSVRFHEQLAASPVGPASGPHDQMAQNIVLSWLAGGRIMELKTVQINDRLQIPRPCIDATNVGYNVEWSQELRIAESLQEYVAGAMLVHMLRRGDFFDGLDLGGPLGETIYDLSIGYDLAGIKSEPVVAFIEKMKDASETIDRLRLHIPARYRHLRDLDYPTKLSSGITLSTFHGCPADEIERICSFLISELDMDVIVKMNPPMLGKERLEHLLHEVLGYHEITVNPTAYTSGLQFDESLQICDRLTSLARRHGKHFGAKFSNTLEVLNHREFFTKDNKVQYLSGAPLHVLTLTLADVFRQAVGPEMPITFSAGVDRHNFANMVACGFCPITTCTDLLRPGGYARLPYYLFELTDQMNKTGARTIEDFILDARGNREDAGGNVRIAAANNLLAIAEETRHQDRYQADRNRAVPKRIGSHLVLFDCVSCDKCIPVCPNDANFIYELPIQRFEFTDWIVGANGKLEPGPAQTLAIERKHQIANFADFCNECGNCDTFCPEYGGPFIEKPNFFGTLEAWKRFAQRDGFHIENSNGSLRIHGRIKGKTYLLEWCPPDGRYLYNDGTVTATFGGEFDIPSLGEIAPNGHVIDMRAFHTLRLLLGCMLDPNRIHQVNAAIGADDD